jgi:pimeloyl-ACP methyl ester carboxylesterase
MQSPGKLIIAIVAICTVAGDVRADNAPPSVDSSRRLEQSDPATTAPAPPGDKLKPDTRVPAVQVVPGNVTSKDGTTIAFERSGDGPTVILVAGALSDRSSGVRLAALLAPHFSVINYDRRGRGGSGDTQPYAVQREVEDIEALIDAAGGSAFLFGSSSGAALALETTTRLPGKVKKAALFEPPFIVDDSRPAVPADFASHMAELASSGRRGDAVEYFMTVGVGVPAEAVAQMRQSPMWPRVEKLAHTLEYDGAVMGDTLAGKPLQASRWAAATSPILVIDGGNSDAWLRHSANALAEILPNAQHHTLQGQDHSASFTAPEAFVPLLVEFFKEPTSAR